MAGYNRVILMGNLTRDPELRYTPSGTAVADLALAVNTPRGRGAERKDDTVFVDITVWERQAETCSEYLSKGSPILVDGRLKLDQWEDRETGKKRSRLTVVGQNVQFLSGGGGGGGGGPRRERSEGPSRPAGGSQGESRQLNDDFDAPDDVPF